MNREEILQVLSDNLQEGNWFLACLSSQTDWVAKEKLKDIVNDFYKEKRGMTLINSRHSHDEFAARLEGAGLVIVETKGRARVYKISELGRELIEFRKKEIIEKNKQKGS